MRYSIKGSVLLIRTRMTLSWLSFKLWTLFQEELLADLHGTIAFKDFILSKGYRMPSVSKGSFRRDPLRGSQLLMERGQCPDEILLFQAHTRAQSWRKGVLTPDRGPQMAFVVLPFSFCLFASCWLAFGFGFNGTKWKGSVCRVRGCC